MDTVSPHICPIANQTYGLSPNSTNTDILSSFNLSIPFSLYHLLLGLLIFSLPCPLLLLPRRRDSMREKCRHLEGVLPTKKEQIPSCSSSLFSSFPEDRKEKKKRKTPLLPNYKEPGGYKVLFAHKQQDRLKMLM